MGIKQQPLHSYARNIAVKMLLQNTFETMEMIGDHLQFWFITELAPEAVVVLKTGKERLANLAMGPITRNERCKLNVDHALITVDGVEFKLPYDAIYCLAATEDLAGDLNWPVSDGLAFANLIQGLRRQP